MLTQAKDSWSLDEAAHLLNRAGFGGDPEEIKALHTKGRIKAVESLVSPKEAIDAFPTPSWAKHEEAIAAARMDMADRRKARTAGRDLSPEDAEKLQRAARRKSRKERRSHTTEAQGWWFRRMLNTKAPLREKMTLFWHDHFPSSFRKVKRPALLVRQNELFRRNAFGSFKELTQEILLDPAMLLYLDTQGSKKGKPNENFAREVMELFTLGEGNYSEQDIREAARAFTGYKLNRAEGKVVHLRKQWDGGSKTIFGQTGNFNGADTIELIFRKPRPAEFMAHKIWEFFAYEKPAPAILESLSKTLRQSDYQMVPLLREIFLSQEFYSTAAVRTQIKSPIQYLIQLLKQLDVSKPPFGFPITAERQLGQVLFMPPNVAGWDWGQAWINTNTLLARYNLAGFITKGAEDTGAVMNFKKGKKNSMSAVPKRMARAWQGPDYEIVIPRSLREDPEQLVDSLIFRFFQGTVPDKARESFIEYAVAKKGVVFTNRETAELCHLMLSTPYYQLC